MTSYEVVFEDVGAPSAIQLVMALVSMAKAVLNVDSTYDLHELGVEHINLTTLQPILSLNGDGCIFLKLFNVQADCVVLPVILLRCLKYGSKFDVDFSFDMVAVENIVVDDLMRNVHCFVQEIAKSAFVENFYGGMEPASDKATRYFTNQVIGPLGIRE
jgi:hypothetical protein